MKINIVSNGALRLLIMDLPGVVNVLEIKKGASFGEPFYKSHWQVIYDLPAIKLYSFAARLLLRNGKVDGLLVKTRILSLSAYR